MDTKPNIYLISQYTSELAVSLKAKQLLQTVEVTLFL